MTLGYNIKGTGVSISDEVRAYIDKRLAHVSKLLADDSAALGTIELQYQTTEDRPRYRAEFTISATARMFRAEAFGDSLHEAIDIAVNELTNEVSRTKQKRLRFARRSAAAFKDFVRGLRDRF
jgi:ribosomal subunit interface protein